MKYALVDNGGQKSITALIDGELYTATSDHPRWGEIVNGVAHDKATAEMFSLEEASSSTFASQTESQWQVGLSTLTVTRSMTRLLTRSSTCTTMVTTSYQW